MAPLTSGFFNVLVNVVAASALVPRRVRRRLLRLAGIKIGTAAIQQDCFIGSPKLSIGDASFINVGVFFDGLGRITVGSDVHIAMGAMLITGSHEIGGPERRAGRLTAADIVIGDGAWIGAGALILPGVTVGSGAVVAGGAVVTSSCEPNAVYAGVPARLVRHLAGNEDHRETEAER